jgi:hypothetical protein
MCIPFRACARTHSVVERVPVGACVYACVCFCVGVWARLCVPRVFVGFCVCVCVEGGVVARARACVHMLAPLRPVEFAGRFSSHP